MLQNCYDTKLKESKDTLLEANPVAVRRKEGIWQVYREIRQIVHAPVVASKAMPEQFPINDLMNVPIGGDPFKLNPEASRARVVDSTCSGAPSTHYENRILKTKFQRSKADKISKLLGHLESDETRLTCTDQDFHTWRKQRIKKSVNNLTISIYES